MNFLADSITGRAEGTLLQVAALQELLTQINPAEVAVIVTAAPVDRRRAFAKWSEAQADFTLAGGDSEEAGATLAAIVQAEARSFGASFASGAIELLLQKVGPNTRLLTEETRKLSTYASNGATAAVIEEAHVEELTPNFAEGDFLRPPIGFLRGIFPAHWSNSSGIFLPAGMRGPSLAPFKTGIASYCSVGCCSMRVICAPPGRMALIRPRGRGRRRPTRNILAGMPKKAPTISLRRTNGTWVSW